MSEKLSLSIDDSDVKYLVTGYITKDNRVIIKAVGTADVYSVAYLSSMISSKLMEPYSDMITRKVID